MTLSTRETLFAWSRADRKANITYFRVLAQHWQPVVRPRSAEEPTARKFNGKLPKCMQQRPTWTPWLLVQ